EDIDTYMAAQTVAIAEQDFDAGVDVVLRAMLQDPRFLYRLEAGAADPTGSGLVELDAFEIARRLSYLLWGTAPADALLASAGSGGLATADGISAEAQRLFADPRAFTQIDRFFALWLGYETLPHAPEVAQAMRNETGALVRRVVFDEDRPFTDLF